MPGLFSTLASRFTPRAGTQQSQPASQPSPSTRPLTQPSSFLPSSRSQWSGSPGGHARVQRPGISGQGLGGKLGPKRRRKIIRDSVYGISKGDIRRIARRGGVKRVSEPIYVEIRQVIKDRIWLVLNDCTKIVEHRSAKTVTTADIIFILKRLGTPIYGFGDVESRPYQRNV